MPRTIGASDESPASSPSVERVNALNGLKQTLPRSFVQTSTRMFAVTGALRPAGARNAGHEAIADASDAQDARMARFSETDSEASVRTSFG